MVPISRVTTGCVAARHEVSTAITPKLYALRAGSNRNTTATTSPTPVTPRTAPTTSVSQCTPSITRHAAATTVTAAASAMTHGRARRENHAAMSTAVNATHATDVVCPLGNAYSGYSRGRRRVNTSLKNDNARHANNTTRQRIRTPASQLRSLIHMTITAAAIRTAATI